MDYKEKFEGFLDKMQGLLDNAKKQGHIVVRVEDLENAFPELRGSENERIRGAIIDHLKDNNLTEWATWLEKQRQEPRKVSIWKHWKDGICGNGEGKLIYLIKNGDAYSLSSSLGFECDYIELSELDNLMLEKQGEQKPNANCLLRWSKEDEKMFQSLEDIVGDYWAKAEQEKNEIKIREASDVSYFLKTIQKLPLCWIKCSDGLPNKDGTYLVVTDGTHNDVYDLARYDSIDGWHKASEIIYWMPIPQLNNKSIIEQKSAEWSEEDEKMLNHIIGLLEGLPILHNWLKSLKQRIGWKPSDEQIDALADALSLAKNCGEEMAFDLRTLLEQLRKLKGE